MTTLDDKDLATVIDALDEAWEHLDERIEDDDLADLRDARVYDEDDLARMRTRMAAFSELRSRLMGGTDAHAS